MILSYDNVMDNEIYNSLFNLKKCLESDYNTFTVFGIGKEYNNINDIHLSYQNALQAIKQGDCYDDICIFDYKPDVGQKYNIYFPLDIQNILENVLCSDSADRVVAFIDEIFTKNQGLPYFYLQIISSEFINIYLTLSQKYNYSNDIKYIYNNLENIYRANVLKEFLSSMFLKLMNNIPDEKKIDTSIMDFVCNYIKDNYSSQSISIQLLADELDLTPAYLSRRFKQQAGVTFTDFLQNYRMEMAKNYLTSTSITIKEISKKVGFGSYSSFVRAFRQTQGITPGEYRKINK